MHISVVIPTYNEADNIAHLVQSLRLHHQDASLQIIVIDGGSNDATIERALAAGADIAIVAPTKGRAAQMNYGTSLAKFDVLYFIHADTQIHPDYASDIKQALDEGYDMGCYRYQFDSKHPLLKVNAFFTRFPFIWCRGGDQTLFIKKQVFEALGRYKHMKIMEEYDLIQRAKAAGYKFKIVPKNVLVSARKYETNNYFRVLYANYKVMKLWRSGTASDEEMATLYKQLLNYR